MPKTEISSGTLRSVIECTGYLYLYCATESVSCYRMSAWLRCVIRQPVEPRGWMWKCDANVSPRTHPLSGLQAFSQQSTETHTITQDPPASRSVRHDLDTDRTHAIRPHAPSCSQAPHGTELNSSLRTGRTCFVHNCITTPRVKKQDTKLLPVTSQILIDFQIFLLRDSVVNLQQIPI